MTFGEVKSVIEESLIQSYKDSKNFKNVLKEFHHNILTNKSLSKLYSLYDDLTTEKGMSESEAKEYLEEGISTIKSILKESKLPRFTSTKSENKYKDLDTLVYTKNINISERIKSKKTLLENLMKPSKNNQETINIPLNSMVSIANQTLKNFVENMDESTKKEFFKVLKSDQKDLEKEFFSLKENTIKKLETLLENQEEFELKTKISETIDRLKLEEFNQMNFLKISSLEKSI